MKKKTYGVLVVLFSMALWMFGCAEKGQQGAVEIVSESLPEAAETVDAADADKVDNEKLIAANQTASKQAQKKQKKRKQAKKNTQKKKNKKDITQQNPSEQGQNPSDSADNERHSQKENPSESSTKQVAPSIAASNEPSVQEPVLDQPTQGREKEPQAADAKGGEAQNAKVSPTQEQQAEEPQPLPVADEPSQAVAEQPQSYQGYLMDQDCLSIEDPKEHETACMLMPTCRASGYGLLILQADGSRTFYLFDEKGQKLTYEYCQTTDREADLRVEITGFLRDGILAVESLREI